MTRGSLALVSMASTTPKWDMVENRRCLQTGPWKFTSWFKFSEFHTQA